jgi:hypothetical protein
VELGRVLALLALVDSLTGQRPIPETGAGVGYVRLEGSPEVVRVRAAYAADEDIRVMADVAAYRHELGEDGEPWTE